MSILKFCSCILASVFFYTASPLVFAQSNLKGEKILIVVSSLDKKTPDLVGGFWFPELTHPVEVFDNAGISYDIASPEGGLPPFDGFDLKDRASLDFWTDPEHRNKLANSIPLKDVNPDAYSVILLVGGHGPMWDFVNNPQLESIVKTMYENNKIISAVCHGPAGLLNIKLSNGESLLKGRHLTGFTAEEEAFRHYDKIVPFELEAALEKNGAIFEEAPIFENKVVVDGQLITGQNPASAKALGDAIVSALQKKA
ncbi:type 1 glutamine amidotransferase domain-containing protein [Klebsiella sp. BIGb0407]|uniref:type 1 glutamine amidotransferase domain-containing protein n=1 Tax=Klebsiella sp. BIGb0407 TaxID=2940603 RepID=UPI0021691672|nr:type 1 glutamine amidotransferase domain-containing protein [Klebsiella sp. BIGb0407]MCS3429558.1 putative intracellular protease/amidase [Klebsiella sp. BIGb0407]